MTIGSMGCQSNLDKVNEQIERLSSPDPVERGWGAVNLGNMGDQTAPAIPYLIDLLDDTTPLEWEVSNTK